MYHRVLCGVREKASVDTAVKLPFKAMEYFMETGSLQRLPGEMAMVLSCLLVNVM